MTFRFLNRCEMRNACIIPNMDMSKSRSNISTIRAYALQVLRLISKLFLHAICTVHWKVHRKSLGWKQNLMWMKANTVEDFVERNGKQANAFAEYVDLFSFWLRKVLCVETIICSYESSHLSSSHSKVSMWIENKIQIVRIYMCVR